MEIFQHGLLSTLPGLVILKDINFTFLDMSQRCANLLGWKNSETCLGKTDFDIPCNALKFFISLYDAV